MNLPEFDDNEYREIDNNNTSLTNTKFEVGPYTGYDKVKDIEEDEKLAKEADDVIIKIGIGALAAIIILGCSTLIFYNINKFKGEKSISTETLNDYKEIQYEEVNNVVADEDIEENKTEIQNFEKDNTEVNSDIESDNNIDYSGAEDFYNHINDVRNNYPDFAESFQNVDDVKNLVDFIYMFNPLYKNMNIKSSIRSQEEFASIIGEYYKSCVKHGIDAKLYLIFNEDSLAYEKVKESEDLANDLKNGKGNDYTIANRYYRFMGENLVDGRTWIDRKTKNAPLIDLLRDQFEEYRYVGNMLEARTYQKNDGLAMPKIEIAHPYQDEVETEVFYDYLTCPDWGIDNVVSKSEEKTETDLVHLEDGQALFQMVDESFKDVLGRSR